MTAYASDDATSSPDAALMSALRRCLGWATCVTVNSHRQQMLDPVFFEMFGIDIAAARSVAVKSRGQFRSAGDLWFTPEWMILQVDLPGLNMPGLSRFGYRRCPHPIFPLDPDMEWAPP